jgi:cysteinyl-tRNA synthetase
VRAATHVAVMDTTRVQIRLEDAKAGRRAPMPERSVLLYNTMSQRLEPLAPVTPGRVGVYQCGLTTYDHSHAGHARSFIAFDVLVRHLRARGYEVTFVRNVTDVDDKILKRAQERGEPPLDFSRRMSEINAAEMRAIGCIEPDLEPRVSETIPEIVALVEKLVAQGSAYVAGTPKGNDVYFAVRSFPAYGKLSHRNVDDLMSGARVEPGEQKRDALDFALWKASTDEEWGWPSPWGRGRPGWHIECSAMSAKMLTPHFDVHCGGMDLIFPHHENEIAQSEAAWGPPLANHWVHAGFLNIDAEKMSKSLGNFVTIQQILDRNDGEALRYFFLGAHYHGPVEFDLEKLADGRVVFPGLDEAERRVEYLYATREALAPIVRPGGPPAGPRAKLFAESPERVLASLDNDLNTSIALSIVGEVARVGNEVVQEHGRKKKDPKALDELAGLAGAAMAALDACCKPLGLMQSPDEAFGARSRERRLKIRGLDATVIEAKVKQRIDARAAKDFARGDAIRAELDALGVELKDTPGAGTTWRVKI